METWVTKWGNVMGKIKKTNCKHYSIEELKEFFQIGNNHYEADAPKCAFPTGDFTINNWNCGLINELRDLIGNIYEHKDYFWSNDQYLFVEDLGPLGLDLNGHNYSFVLLSIYKTRGGIDGVWILDDKTMRIPNEEEVKKIVKHIIVNRKQLAIESAQNKLLRRGL